MNNKLIQLKRLLADQRNAKNLETFRSVGKQIKIIKSKLPIDEDDLPYVLMLVKLPD